MSRPALGGVLTGVLCVLPAIALAAAPAILSEDPVSIVTVVEAERVLDATVSARERLDHDLAVRRRECAQRLLVNACINDLESTRRADEARLRALEIRARMVLREERAQARNADESARDLQRRADSDADAQDRAKLAAERQQRLARNAERAAQQAARAQEDDARAAAHAAALARREAELAERAAAAERKAREAQSNVAAAAQRQREHEARVHERTMRQQRREAAATGAASP